jgi:TolB-like protein/class 3 adenylate cyclase
MPSERRLAAILFTDIVGYTALMAESEESGLAARQRHRELVRPLVGVFNGEVIETRADESLSTFPSALEAVNCALAIEDALQGEPGLRLHLGVHLGDIVVGEGEVSGDGVNIASRICALSDGGGICISGQLYDAIRSHPEIEATSRGEHDLKNVGRPVQVYSIARRAAAGAAPELTDQGAARSTSARAIALGAVAASVVLLVALAAWFWTSEPAPLDPIRSIAVLPLANLSGDPSQEYFTDGMTEALISNLAKLAAFDVVSRTSVLQYRGARKPMPQIARELDVEAVLEGSVLRAGDAVRITVQLIDAQRDRHLWSQSYERDLHDILQLQSEVARAVADEIHLKLAPADQAQLASTRRVDPEAYDAYLKGVHFLNKQGASNHTRAVQLLEQAVAVDPDYAAAWARLADGYT